MASSFPERGLVADVYLHRRDRRQKRSSTKRNTVLAVLFGFTVVLMCQLVHANPEEDAASAQDTEADQSPRTYELAVHMLNHTSRATNGSATAFTFDAGQLPFDFTSLLFDEFRGDTEYSSRYYAGMSLLAWAKGTDSCIDFLECGGKPIEEIAYQGQPLVVLNGWESVSRDGQGKVIDHKWGSMQIAAYDWRDGCWSPEGGIEVEHPPSVTISSAALCLMVYEPASITDIAEFDIVFAVGALAVIVAAARRLRA